MLIIQMVHRAIKFVIVNVSHSDQTNKLDGQHGDQSNFQIDSLGDRGDKLDG